MAGRKFRPFDLREGNFFKVKIKISFFLIFVAKENTYGIKGQKKVEQDGGMNTESERKVLDKKSAVQSMFSKSADITGTFKTKLE